MTRAARKQAHRDLAAWCRDHGVTPNGAAWAAVKDGSRDTLTLRRLNVAEGCAARVTPDGSRLAAGIRDGDIIAGRGTVLGAPVTDPDTGNLWVTVAGADGTTDIELAPSDVVDVARVRRAPAWIQAAAADYRAARDTWEAARESGMPAPSSVPGVAGSNASMMQLEPGDYAAAYPRPRYADFVRDHADRNRETT